MKIDLIQLNIDELKLLKDKISAEIFKKISTVIHPEDSFSSEENFICPHCNSTKTVRNGKSSQGKQRYLCRDCNKTSIITRNTLMFSSKKSVEQWGRFIESLLNGDPVITNAEKSGISDTTAFRWRIKAFNVIVGFMNNDVLEGTVYLDETLVNKVSKNPNIEHNPNKKRGMSNDKINIACAIDNNSNTIIKVSEYGRIKANTLIDIYKGNIKPNSVVVSDSLRSYHKLMKELDVIWKKIPSKKKCIDEYNLDPVNHLHALIKDFLYKYKGVSEKYLQGYLGLFKLVRETSKSAAFNAIEGIFSKIIGTLGHIRCKDIDDGLIKL
jgi:transposase-like protein